VPVWLPEIKRGYGPTPETLSDLLIPCRDGRIRTGDPLTSRHESGVWTGLRESGGEPPPADSLRQCRGESGGVGGHWLP
jgi:hypothetical protein